MDAMERQEAHERYNPPVVGVGDVVLYRHRRRNVYSMGVVSPPQTPNWKPGDPVGKAVSILVTEAGRHNYIATDTYHYLDPKYVHDPNNQNNCWQEISAASPSDVLAIMNELLGKVNIMEAELQVKTKDLNVALQRIKAIESRLSSRQPSRSQDITPQTPAKSLAASSAA